MKTQKKRRFRLWVSAFLGVSGSIIAVPTLAEEGVPGVLRFAEQYRAEQSQDKVLPGKTGTSSGKSKQETPVATSAERLGSSSGKTLISNAELKRRLALREREMTQLKKENSRLRAQPVASSSDAEVALREQLSTVNAQLTTAQAEHKQALDTLAEQGTLARKSLESQILSLTQTVGTLETTNATLQTSNQKDIDTLKLVGEQYQALKGEVESLDTETTRLKTLQKTMPVVSAEALSAPDMQQTYAAGVMLGRDVLAMQQAQALLGLAIDNRVLLAGLRDALNSQVLLNSEALQSALMAAEEGAQKARQTIAAQQKKVGETYLTTFKQGKGIKQDPLGFWYRVEHLGDGEMIKDEESLVDVVVVEKLTDGTVVEDMEARGRVISQPLNEYPALFRAALSQLKDHGSMTLVVPSSLAYGDEGYPPKVPPGATLVYTLRVEQVKAESQPFEAEKDIPEQKAKAVKK